jgi:hypothetical protein
MTHIYGYEESKVHLMSDKSAPLKDSIAQQLSEEAVYYNGSDDSIFLYRYKAEYRIVLWKIQQYENIPIQLISESKEPIFKIADGSEVSNINSKNKPFLWLKVKMRLTNEKKMYLCFDRKSTIFTRIINKNYQYYYLNCFKIGLSTNNSTCDLIINKERTSQSNLFICNINGNLNLILMSSLTNEDIDADLLYNLINFKDL